VTTSRYQIRDGDPFSSYPLCLYSTEELEFDE
jgi:hypothetical protein